MKILLKVLITIIIISLTTGCGGSGGSSGDSTPPETSLSGEVIYGPASGIDYVCSSGIVGSTDSLANFSCNVGDNVSFYIGSILVATLDAKSGITTPYEFFPSDTTAALNYVRLLQAIDGNTSSDLIVVDPSISALIPVDTDFSSPSFDSDIETALGVSLITLTEAQNNLNNAIIAAGGDLPLGSNIPIANAGPDQTLASVDVILDGAGSSDLDGDALSYDWSIVSKPLGSIISLSNTTVVNPTFTADVTGDYIFELSVSDGISTSPSDQVIITITGGNFTPISNAGVDQNIPTGSLVTLDGSASFDANGDTLNYNWTLVAKPAASAAVLSSSTIVNPSFTADKDGIYTFELIVDDGVLFSGTDTIFITAATGNSVPVADAGIDQSIPTTSVVTLDGSASSDSNGDGLTYSWSVFSKPLGSTVVISDAAAANPYFTAYLDGEYIFELVVNDGTVDSIADSVSIIASTANSAPIANAGVDQNIPTGSLVTLDGSVSFDANGDGITYLWSVSSNPTGSTITLSNATVVNPNFTADLDGTYTLQLVVNDGSLNSLADSVTVTASTANSAPVANAGVDASTYTGQALALDGSGSSDADLDSLTFAWTIFSNPVGSTTASFSDPALESPTFTADVSGSYVLQLIVNDGTVYSIADTVTITAIDFTTVKKTGQTTSYVAFDDGDYIKGTDTVYTLIGDVVTDSITGLMWQDDNPTVNNFIRGSDAEAYCSALSLDIYTDWRLPSTKEFLNLADRSKNPSIDQTVFRSIANFNQVWSRDITDSASEQRLVDFFYGDESSVDSGANYLVRCVRNTTTNSLPLRDDVNNVVIDSQHKLIWQDDTIPAEMDWADAVGYCEGLNLAGASDWRLPNINELLTVVDLENDQSVFINVFNNNPSNAWSSTTVAGKTDKAFSVYNPSTTIFLFTTYYKSHISSDEAKTSSLFVNTEKRPKCVRDLP